MPYWPTKRNIAYDPNKVQCVIRTYTIPYGYFSYGPFDSVNQALNWANDRDWAVDEFELLLATKRSPWKSMIDPEKF